MADLTKTREYLNVLAEAIDTALNGPDPTKPQFGFALLVGEFGKFEGGMVNYVSNGDRETMTAMLREYLARVEGRYSEPAHRPQ